MRRARLALPLLAVTVVVGLAGLATRSRADDLDLPATLDGIKTALAEKRYGRAQGDLQLVLAEVARLRTEVLKARLPAAPEGWKAEEAEGQDAAALAALGGGTVVRRPYTKGEARVTVELMVGASMWSAPLQTLLSNPAFLGAGLKPVTVKGRRGLLELRPDDKRATLQLLLNNVANGVLRIDGEGVTRDDVEKTFGNAFDFDAAEKAAAE
ncbi:MAG: hypothetical protein JNM10_13400 [Planctomycetia bacterium]|nr:hypothetical protein [Planctomycetia bacterium]